MLSHLNTSGSHLAGTRQTSKQAPQWSVAPLKDLRPQEHKSLRPFLYKRKMSQFLPLTLLDRTCDYSHLLLLLLQFDWYCATIICNSISYCHNYSWLLLCRVLLLLLVLRSIVLSLFIFCHPCSSVLAHPHPHHHRLFSVSDRWPPTLNWESGIAQGFCHLIRQLFSCHCHLGACSRWEQLAIRVCDMTQYKLSWFDLIWSILLQNRYWYRTTSGSYFTPKILHSSHT